MWHWCVALDRIGVLHWCATAVVRRIGVLHWCAPCVGPCGLVCCTGVRRASARADWCSHPTNHHILPCAKLFSLDDAGAGDGIGVVVVDWWRL